MEGTAATTNRSPEVMALLTPLAEIALMDVNAATGLPAGVYTSRAFHEAEQTALFEHGWLCVGRSEDVPAPGGQAACDIDAPPPRGRRAPPTSEGPTSEL